jgi:ParB-like chromosome segregation protein Spo0J
MINTIVPLSEIDFAEEEPGEVLTASIAQRGIAIPVHVNRTASGYVCVDGRKRLTACRRLQEKDARFRRIPVMICNDYSKAGSAFWGATKNHH